MSLFAAIQQSNVTTKEADVLGGSFTVPSNVYPAAIKMAYLDKAETGTIYVMFDFALLVNGKERSYKESIRISNTAGKFTYTDKKTGEEKPNIGFATVDSICKAVTGKAIHQLSTEKKTVKVYDFNQRAEVPMEKEVLMDLIKGRLELGILETIVDVKTKASNFEPTGETKVTNEISKAFTADGMTPLEVENGATETKFKDAWIKQYADKKINKAKGAATGAKAGGVTKPAPQAGALFG